MAARNFLKDNALTIVLIIVFALTFVGTAWSGWLTARQILEEHGAGTISLADYLRSGHFISAIFENWESEFLQMGAYVVLTAMLFQRGSAESRDPDDPERPRDPKVSVRNFARWLYAHSLGLALFALFMASFVLHLLGSAAREAREAAVHGTPQASLWDHLGSAQMWFESMQNWQSEFLSTAVLVVLSIFLRQQGSPESKPLLARHDETGA
jgi:hypothetical protein